MKYKVINDNAYPVGMAFEDGRETIIFKNSFFIMDKKDILEIHSKSKLFSESILKVEDKILLSEMASIREICLF